VAKSKKKIRSHKPITNRKGIQENNKKLLDFFSSQMQGLRKDMGEFQNRVAESNQQLWSNQQAQRNGLSGAEEHVMLLRRVFNDALGGVTRVKTIERKNPEGEAQVIDWDWYAEQLHFSENKQDFMNGEVIEPEVMEKLKEKAALERKQQMTLHALWKAAESDEDALRAAYDEGGLSELLEPFRPKGATWDAQNDELAAELVEKVLSQREAARKQQEKMEAAKERAILKTVLTKLYTQDEQLVMTADDEHLHEAVQGGLPSVVKWTDRMAEVCREVANEVVLEAAEKAKENDPEEVEAAKQELLEETKKFGEEAREVIDLIESGDEVEARKRMAALEQKVKDKEAEADAQGAPPIPDGAAVFGG
jgi:hypothetical protein